MAQLTESIVEFLSAEHTGEPPSAARLTAINGFTDCLGVMVAGESATVTRLLLSKVCELPGGGMSRLLLSAQRSAPAAATLVGVTSAHALDYDDYAYSNHVSALLVPAIIADAERVGASGAEMIQAYLAGFEVWGTLFKREPDHLHSKGWHPTGIFGALGVAAALCRLRRVDADTCRNALGLAAVSGGGVMDNFGSAAKCWQGGRAAEAGVVAVELACLGLDAGPHALDGDGGLMAALSPRQRVDRSSPALHLGRQWMSAAGSLNIKRHPTVGASQRAIDAAIQVHRDFSPDPESIARVTVRVSEKHAAVMRLHRPWTASEARFSLEFCVAAGLLFGRVGLAELRDPVVQSPEVQALIEKVHTETGPDDDPSYPVGARYDWLSVDMNDGRQLKSEWVYRFLGHGENPMSTDELQEKFMDCSVPRIGAASARELFDAARGLESLSSVHDLPTLSFQPD